MFRLDVIDSITVKIFFCSSESRATAVEMAVLGATYNTNANYNAGYRHGKHQNEQTPRMCCSCSKSPEGLVRAGPRESEICTSGGRVHEPPSSR